jgi:hypothetical protein
MGGQRSLISKDVRELEKVGKARVEIVLDAAEEVVGRLPRTRSQKILVIRKVTDENAESY